MKPDDPAIILAQAVPLPPDLGLGWWSLLLDANFMIAWVMLLVFVPLLIWARRGHRFVNRQTTYLDHQQQATDRIIDQNQDIQRSVEAQYARTNAASDVMLEHSQTALKVQAEILAELKAMNASLARLAPRA
jgi:hypothetical protein